MPPIHVTTWSEAAAPAARAILIHGTMTWGTECFAEQQSLGRQFRVEVPDRRGFGDSPDTAQSDWEVDAEDIAALLDQEPAHLVGHSYGGVVAMVAAILRPDAVLSLTLIEPSALHVAESVPVVAKSLAANRAAFTTDPPLIQQITPEDYTSGCWPTGRDRSRPWTNTGAADRRGRTRSGRRPARTIIDDAQAEFPEFKDSILSLCRVEGL
jgi:pimeloyl-ACP methyl ester carboxylesterase